MYIMKKHSRPFLEKRGYKYSQSFSDSDTTCYIKRFPVYKYQDFFILFAEIRVILETGEAFVDCFDSNTGRSYYASYYIRDYGDCSRLLEIVDKNIATMFRKDGITEVEKDDESVENNTDQIHTKQRRKNNNPNSAKPKRRLDRPQSSGNNRIKKRRIRTTTSGDSNETSKGV